MSSLYWALVSNLGLGLVILGWKVIKHRSSIAKLNARVAAGEFVCGVLRHLPSPDLMGETSPQVKCDCNKKITKSEKSSGIQFHPELKEHNANA